MEKLIVVLFLPGSQSNISLLTAIRMLAEIEKAKKVLEITVVEIRGLDNDNAILEASLYREHTELQKAQQEIARLKAFIAKQSN